MEEEAKEAAKVEVARVAETVEGEKAVEVMGVVATGVAKGVAGLVGAMEVGAMEEVTVVEVKAAVKEAVG